MATLHHITTPPSTHTSRQLHPSVEPAGAVPAEVLREIAGGLSRTVAAPTAGPGRTVLLATSAYEAAIEAIEINGCQVVGGVEPVAVARAAHDAAGISAFAPCGSLVG